MKGEEVKEQKPGEGAILGFRDDYRFLSNFWEAAFIVDGKAYRTSESYYQAHKAARREDFVEIAESHPGKAKRLGRKVEMVEFWDHVKDSVMGSAIHEKFMQHSDLCVRLAETEGEIYEVNDWGDMYWGCCYDDDGKLLGENRLGELLMKLRESCRRRLREPMTLAWKVTVKRSALSDFYEAVEKSGSGVQPQRLKAPYYLGRFVDKPEHEDNVLIKIVKIYRGNEDFFLDIDRVKLEKPTRVKIPSKPGWNMPSDDSFYPTLKE